MEEVRLSPNNTVKPNETFKIVNTSQIPSKKTNNKIVKKNEKSVDLNNVQVYPNPVQDELKIILTSTERSSVSLHIKDMTGKTVLTIREQDRLQIGNNSFTAPTRMLPGGVYYLEVIKDKKTSVHKIVVVH